MAIKRSKLILGDPLNKITSAFIGSLISCYFLQQAIARLLNGSSDLLDLRSFICIVCGDIIRNAVGE